MPFSELPRRDSWPPTLVKLRENERHNLDDIDENPISFFLTTPEDIDDILDDDEDLSAGIETPDSDRSPVREISPSGLESPRQGALLDAENSDDEFGLAVPVTLKDFTLRHISGRKSRTNVRPENKAKGLGITLPDSSMSRGRPQVRLIPTRSARGRGQTRSLSARRPQSWREPSPELFPIQEEKESEEDQFAVKASSEQAPISTSAPASTKTGMDGLEVDILKQKPKKRVHWAF